LFNFDLNLTPTLNLESINGIPQYTFTLPALPKTDLQGLFNSFKLPDFAVSFLADLANFNVTIGTDLLTFEGIGDINLTPLINGLGFGELVTTDFSIGLPTFEIKTIEGIDYFNVSLPSVNKPELQNLLNGLNLPEFASNLLSNLSNLQFTIGEDWFQFTALEPINLSPIINNFGFGDLLDFDLNLVPTINVELIDGVKQFSLSLPPLSQADLQGLLDSLGLPDLAVNFLAELGQIELTIGDNFLKLNGLEGVDFAPIINELGVVNLPEFTVGIPSFEMFKVDGINEFKFTIPQIDEIQVNNLLDGLDGLPSFAKDFFNVLDKIKVELGEDWTRITYLDEVGITSIVNNLSGELGFTTDINADISVFLPSLYIQEINGEKFYEVTLPQISTGEVMGLLGEMTDVNLFNELTTLGKVDLVLSEDSFRVKYFDDVKLDLGKVVEIDSSLTFLQEGISGIVAMFGGTETSLTLDTPDLILTKTTLGTEINLDTLFNGSDFDLQIQGDKVNLNYEGSIDVFALVNSVMSQLTNVDISEILKLMGTGINVDINVINGVKKLAFDVDSLETVSLPNLFNLFDLSLPDFAIDFLGELPSVNFNLDGDLLNFTGLGEIDLSGILNGLEFGLNLGSLNVNLPSLQLDLSGSLPNYQLTIPPLPKATFDTLFGSLGLPKFATDFLGELGNVSFNIGTDFFQIKGLGDVDLRNILNGFGLNLDTNLDFSVSFPTLDIQLIDGVKNFALTIPELPNITLSNLLDSFPEMPNFMVDFLVGLGDIDLTIGNDFINFDFLGEVDIRGMLNGLSVDLGLGELDATFGAFNVENPTINLKGLGTPNLSYHVNIPSVDFDGIINLLTDLGGVSLPDSIKLKLASLGDIGLTISDLGLALDFENDFSLNLGNLFSLDGAVPYMDTALDSLISGIFGTPDLTLSTPNLSLLKDVNLGGMNLELDGLLNGQNFGFTFGNSITFNYDLPNDLDFTTLLPNIPILGDVKLLDPQIFLTDLSHSITLPELGKIDLVSGLNLAGTIDFAGLDTNFGNFINGLGIDNLDVNLGFNPAGLTSLWGSIDGDFDLFSIDSFKVGFSDLNLGLDIGVDLEPGFGLSGNFLLKDMTPHKLVNLL
uniref:hypothetical protein n=1 Tax=Cyanothece sp. BG0011 TaxID=2082950 RepID=UPI0018E569F5